MARKRRPLRFAGRNTPGAGGGLGGAYAPVPRFGPDNPDVNAAGFGDAETKLGSGGSGSSGPDLTGPRGTETGQIPDLDWATAFFGSLGLPPDVVGEVNKLFSQYSDVNAATAAALGYIRGTPWYAQTYPGINEGIQKGVVSNEADYRQRLNQESQLYRQYLGRDVTSGEFAASLQEGVPLSTVGGRLQGASLAGTYGNDWRYVLGAYDTGAAPSPDEVKALGEESAGLDSPLGQAVKRRLDLAQQRLEGVFRGSLGTPGLSLANGRLAAPGLSAGTSGDVAA